MKPWIQTSKKLLLETRIFRIFEAGFHSQASGKNGLFNLLETKDWITVVPETPEGTVLMVKQFRYGIGKVTLEFPAGVVEHGQSPLEAAHRELAEETGATGEVSKIG
ncbi:MAG: NUDIX hydrolase, partial [Bdellovibrionota bacterium]